MKTVKGSKLSSLKKAEKEGKTIQLYLPEKKKWIDISSTFPIAFTFPLEHYRIKNE